MHRSGKKEAPKEEKIQPLCWTKGPLLESRKETALSSPRNDALSAAIPACWRGCGNGRWARRRRGRGAVVAAVAKAEAEAMAATGMDGARLRLASFINRGRRRVCVEGEVEIRRRDGNLRVLWMPPQAADARSPAPLSAWDFVLLAL